MAYTKTVWTNSNLPGISADSLNHIKEGIEAAHNAIDSTNTKLTSLTTYSTEEINTGKVSADGKPIYRKDFKFTSWSSLGYDTGITDIDCIEDSKVSLKNTQKSAWLNLMYNEDGVYGYYIKKTADTYKILIQNNSEYSADKVSAMIEYTKEADEVVENE